MRRVTDEIRRVAYQTSTLSRRELAAKEVSPARLNDVLCARARASATSSNDRVDEIATIIARRGFMAHGFPTFSAAETAVNANEGATRAARYFPNVLAAILQTTREDGARASRLRIQSATNARSTSPMAVE